MKQKPYTLILLLLIAISISGCQHVYSESDQRALAKEIQVLFDGKQAFPQSYFIRVLEVGMTPEEVHSIIKGYEKVFHCSGYEI